MGRKPWGAAGEPAGSGAGRYGLPMMRSMCHVTSGSCSLVMNDVPRWYAPLPFGDGHWLGASCFARVLKRHFIRQLW
ncbi:hypothetical protein VDGL01_12136 [Verticillium dahliae]